MSKLLAWARRNEFMLGFGFVFVGLHVTWFNLQRHVPDDYRSELRAYRAIKAFLFPEAKQPAVSEGQPSPASKSL